MRSSLGPKKFPTEIDEKNKNADFGGNFLDRIFLRSTPVEENVLWVALSVAIFFYIASVRDRALARNFIDETWTFRGYRDLGLYLPTSPSATNSYPKAPGWWGGRLILPERTKPTL